MSRVYRPMDSVRRWFIVNSRRWPLEELAEARLAGTTEPGSSPRKGEKGEGTLGSLATGRTGDGGAESGRR
jgi:hypothetical protein